MDKKKQTIWFPAMSYGIGWGLPITWQGWLVYLLYFVLLLAGGLLMATSPIGAGLYVIYVMILSALLIFICWKKGEKPEFRWGNKKLK